MEEGNIFLFDWLAFSMKCGDPFRAVELLGMSEVSWHEQKGRYGYRQALAYDHVEVMYDGTADMGVCVQMSGQGCRCFESFSKLAVDPADKWKILFDNMEGEKVHVTRLDIAFDDHTGVLDMDAVFDDTLKGNFVTRFGQVDFNGSRNLKRDLSFGRSVQFGKDKILIRIYDKAAERHCEPGTHWIRCELKLTDDLAGNFLVFRDNIGTGFCGVVLNYLRFVKPDSKDSNKWRWPLRPYWKKMIGEAEKIKIYLAPGIDYNMDRLQRIVFQQYGNAIDAALEIFGTDHFVEQVKQRTTKPNPKYTQLVDEIKSSVEEIDYLMNEKEGKRLENEGSC